jgi:hypothetical protein
MEEENRQCVLPEKVRKFYTVLFLGKQKNYFYENGIIHIVYEYSEELNGDNKGQEYVWT